MGLQLVGQPAATGGATADGHHLHPEDSVRAERHPSGPADHQHLWQHHGQDALFIFSLFIYLYMYVPLLLFFVHIFIHLYFL